MMLPGRSKLNSQSDCRYCQRNRAATVHAAPLHSISRLLWVGKGKDLLVNVTSNDVEKASDDVGPLVWRPVIPTMNDAVIIHEYGGGNGVAVENIPISQLTSILIRRRACKYSLAGDQEIARNNWKAWQADESTPNRWR